MLRSSHIRLISNKVNLNCLVRSLSLKPNLLKTENVINTHLRKFELKPRGFHSSVPYKKIVSFNLADIGEGITECELIQWFVKPGDKIAQFDRICEVQSDKASVEITSRYDGIITKLYVEAGNMANVGSPLVDIDTADEDVVDTAKESPKEEVKPTEVKENKEVKFDANFEKALTLATPAVRRIARENNVDLSKVTPTGKGSRVTKEDILTFIKGGHVSNNAPTVTQTQAAPSPSPVTLAPASGEEVIQPLNAIQKAMFKAMTASLSIPHFGYSDEFNLNKAAELRKIINTQLASSNDPDLPKKISYMPILIKALSVALLKFPLLNARLTYAEDGTPQLAYRAFHNIGVAMDTPNGLVVPSIKDVQNKSITEIAKELNRLQALGQKNQLSSSDLKGGTITLSNIGTVGGTYLSPVVVTSELCIGALGRIQKLPRFETIIENGKSIEVVRAHSIMPISFSADHRVVDGATVARFSEAWRALVENPISLLAHLK